MPLRWLAKVMREGLLRLSEGLVGGTILSSQDQPSCDSRGIPAESHPGGMAGAEEVRGAQCVWARRHFLKIGSDAKDFRLFDDSVETVLRIVQDIGQLRDPQTCNRVEGSMLCILC